MKEKESIFVVLVILSAVGVFADILDKALQLTFWVSMFSDLYH